MENSCYHAAFVATVFTIDEWVQGTDTPRMIRVIGVILFSVVGFFGPFLTVRKDTIYMGKLKGFFSDAAKQQLRSSRACLSRLLHKLPIQMKVSLGLIKGTPFS